MSSLPKGPSDRPFVEVNDELDVSSKERPRGSLLKELSPGKECKKRSMVFFLDYG